MATKTATKSNTESKPPVAKLRLGLIQATVWERTTDKGAFFSVTFERRYRDAAGEWHSSQSFDKANLLTLAKLADQADTEISRLMASQREKTAA